MSADFRTGHFKGWQHDGYVHVARVDGDGQEYPLGDLTAGEVAELAGMTSPDPNPLDARLLAMAGILRETGDGDTADEIEVNAAYVREAWRGSDDRGIADALEIISACAGELAKIARYSRPSAALKADMDARDEEESNGGT